MSYCLFCVHETKITSNFCMSLFSANNLLYAATLYPFITLNMLLVDASKCVLAAVVKMKENNITIHKHLLCRGPV